MAALDFVHLHVHSSYSLLEGALNAIKKRSLVFIISDFISLPGWEKHLGALSRRHEVLGFAGQNAGVAADAAFHLNGHSPSHGDYLLTPSNSTRRSIL